MARIVNGAKNKQGESIILVKWTPLELGLAAFVTTILIGLGAWNLKEAVENGRWIAAHDAWSKARSEQIEQEIQAEAEARRLGDETRAPVVK